LSMAGWSGSYTTPPAVDRALGLRQPLPPQPVSGSRRPPSAQVPSTDLIVPQHVKRPRVGTTWKYLPYSGLSTPRWTHNFLATMRTEVFNPVYKKSQSFRCCIGMDSGTKCGSPSLASAFIWGPPPPPTGSPRRRAILSNASPSESSNVPPRMTYHPIPRHFSI
jgi:hypothetical protein